MLNYDPTKRDIAKAKRNQRRAALHLSLCILIFKTSSLIMLHENQEKGHWHSLHVKNYPGNISQHILQGWSLRYCSCNTHTHTHVHYHKQLSDKWKRLLEITRISGACLSRYNKDRIFNSLYRYSIWCHGRPTMLAYMSQEIMKSQAWVTPTFQGQEIKGSSGQLSISSLSLLFWSELTAQMHGLRN